MDRYIGFATLVWAVVYVYLGVVPISPGRVPGGRFDLVAHFVATALLAALLIDWQLRRPVASPVPARLPVVVACVLALGVELIQALISFREFEVVDLVADALGAVGVGWSYPRVSGLLGASRLSTVLVVLAAAASATGLAVTTFG